MAWAGSTPVTRTDCQRVKKKVKINGESRPKLVEIKGTPEKLTPWLGVESRKGSVFFLAHLHLSFPAALTCVDTRRLSCLSHDLPSGRQAKISPSLTVFSIHVEPRKRQGEKRLTALRGVAQPI